MHARIVQTLILVAVLGLGLVALPACGDSSGDAGTSGVGDSTSYAKEGFEVVEQDGRLWVFETGSEDYKSFQEHGEPAKSVTSIGTGPNGMSIRSGDMATIKAYLAK